MSEPFDSDIDDSPEAQRLNAERWRKLEAAAAAPGFSGELRRAIDAARVPSHRLAARCVVDVAELEAFREGDSELPSGAIDRLVAELGLTLIPAEQAEST
jgi:hypothetical protein